MYDRKKTDREEKKKEEDNTIKKMQSKIRKKIEVG